MCAHVARTAAGLVLVAGLVAAFALHWRRRRRRQQLGTNAYEAAAGQSLNPQDQQLLQEACASASSASSASSRPPAVHHAVRHESDSSSNGLLHPPPAVPAAPCWRTDASIDAHTERLRMLAIDQVDPTNVREVFPVPASRRGVRRRRPAVPPNMSLPCAVTDSTSRAHPRALHSASAPPSCNAPPCFIHRASRLLASQDERALVPVTPLTPFQSHIPLDVKLGSGGGEVRLLPVTLGKGERTWDAWRVGRGFIGGTRLRHSCWKVSVGQRRG
jgi:hypothetical protein